MSEIANPLARRVDNLRRVDCSGNVFEFRDGECLIALIVGATRNGPWKVTAGHLPQREFVSWTAASHYLKAGFIEQMITGGK